MDHVIIAVRLHSGTDPADVLAQWSPIALGDHNLVRITANTAVDRPGAQLRDAPVELLLTLETADVDRAEHLPGWDLLAAAADEIRAWVVAPHHQITWDRTWPDGETAPGVKMVSFMRRAPERTHAEFAEHWTQRHTPLARRHHPGLWNYVQNVVVRPLTEIGADIDGVAELHFRSQWSFEHEFFDSDEGRAVILADIPRFMAPPGRDGSLMTETPLRTLRH